MSRRMGAIIALLLALLLVGCQAAPVATPQVVVVTATPAPVTPTTVPPTQTPVVKIITATPAPTQTPAPKPVLELVGLDGKSQTFTMTDLQKLPVSEGFGGTKSSTGKISPPTPLKGVALGELAKLAGMFDDKVAVSVEAKDGYAMTYSYDQITKGDFTAFDPGTGDELQRDEALTVVVVYAANGKPLDEAADGALRLAIISPKGDQVTDGHWAVKWVTKVVLKPASAEWTLHLEGAMVEEIDRNTFESGASPSCHQETWKDADGHEWAGIPLYYLAGRVDDVTSKHEGDAFNDELANQGYTIDIVAADGYKVTLDAAKTKRNKGIIVANTVDGQPLDEKNFPLKLVGAELSKKESVGAIAQIVLSIPLAPPTPAATAAATVAPTAASAGAAATGKAPEMKAGWVHVWGLVETPTAFDEAAMKQVGTVKLTLEHPKKGPTEYEGVRLNDLLAVAKPQAAATKLLLTSGDGFTAEVALADVKACADCLVAISDGSFSLAMPGMAGGAWAKDVRLIELK